MSPYIFTLFLIIKKQYIVSWRLNLLSKLKTILPNLTLIIVEPQCVLIETRENGSRTKGEISKIALYGDCLSRVLFRGNWNRYLSRYWLTQTVSLIVIFLLYHHSWLNNTVSSDWAGVKFPLSFEREIVKWLFPMSNKFLVWNPFPKKWNFSILKNTHTLFLFFL